MTAVYAAAIHKNNELIFVNMATIAYYQNRETLVEYLPICNGSCVRFINSSDNYAPC